MAKKLNVLPVKRLAALAASANDLEVFHAEPAERRVLVEYHKNNWEAAKRRVVDRSRILRVAPWPSAVPTVFRFVLRRPYKRGELGGGEVRLAPGPIRGVILCRANPFAHPGERSVAAALDERLELVHPNYSRRFGFVCLGDLPPGPFPLDALLEHLYTILSYQNVRTSSPADRDAARYFASTPDALAGLTPVPPLYEATP